MFFFSFDAIWWHLQSCLDLLISYVSGPYLVLFLLGFCLVVWRLLRAAP
jgi:hypothetical protein